MIIKNMKVLLLFFGIIALFQVTNVYAAKVTMSTCTNYAYTQNYFNTMRMNQTPGTDPTAEVHLMYTTDGRLVYCSELGRPLWPYGADPNDPLPNATYIVTSKIGAYEALSRTLAYGYNSNSNVDAGGNNTWAAKVSCSGQEERIATQMLIHMINKDYRDGGIPWETYTASNIKSFFATGSSSGINKIANYFVEIRNKVVSEGKTPNFNPKTVTLKYNESSHRWSGSTTDTAKVLQEKDWIVTNSGTVNLSISGNTITMNDSDGSPTSGAITLSRSIYNTGTIYKSNYDDIYQETIYYITAEPTLKSLRLNYTLEQIGKGQVKINKTDSYTKEKISGVRFGIYSDSNCKTKATDYLGNPLEEKTTNANGEVEWNNLYYPINGSKNYYIKEISISSDYESDEVGVCKRVNVNKNETTIDIENVPKGKGTVKINKTDSYTKEKISGVRFGIYSDSNCKTKATDYLGNPLEEKTTNANGEVEWNNLYYPINGSKNYYIKEISISSDYESDEVGVCKRVNVNKNETTIDIENVPKGKGTVKINKTDSYTKEKISGVRFGIYSDSNCKTKATDYLGNPLEEKTTNANGEVEWNNLYYPINGSKDYYIKEISVPAEYEEDEVGICKKVTIKAEDNEYADDKEEVEINIENIPKGKATILVNKIDKYTGGPISGVKFGIYQDNKCTVKATNYKGEEYEVKETNKIGMLQWEELYYPIGENGEKKYYIKEEEVPNSYTVDEEQLTNLGAENGCVEIEVKKAGEEIGLTTIEMQTLYNIPYGNITIMKRDAETDEVIEGVEFRLLKHVPDAENNPAEDINGNIVANEVTGPNGVAEFKDIPYGDYILEEVRTNGSYEILEEPIEFTLSEENDALKFKAQGTEALPEDELIPLETYRVGDPTDDGKIDNSDVELIEWIINKETEEEVTAKQRYASDVNGDEQVTEVDKDLVISYIEGSTDSIPNALEEKVIPGQYQKRVTLTVTNVPIDIKISKYEIAKEKELKGAKIKILNSEGEVFYEYTSKGEREEFGISTGEYTLIEETSPKGYENLQIEIKFRVGTDGNIEIISEETNLYKIIKSEEEKDKDMDHIIIYNKLAEVKVPNTASTITVVGIALGIGLIGYGGYQVYRRYKTIGI